MTLQEAVRKELRTKPVEQRGCTPRGCSVSDAIERPWGRAYRVVVWSRNGERGANQCVVPADCSASEVVQVVLAHVPGRRFNQDVD